MHIDSPSKHQDRDKTLFYENTVKLLLKKKKKEYRYWKESSRIDVQYRDTVALHTCAYYDIYVVPATMKTGEKRFRFRTRHVVFLTCTLLRYARRRRFQDDKLRIITTTT